MTINWSRARYIEIAMRASVTISTAVVEYKSQTGQFADQSTNYGRDGENGPFASLGIR